MFFSRTPRILGTCTVGGVSKDTLLARLHAAGVEIEGWAMEIITHPTFAIPTEPETVQFATLSLKGYKTFGKMTPRATITDLLTKVGGHRCKPADALFVLLLLTRTGALKRDGKFECAMEPIQYLDKDFDVFVAERKYGTMRLLTDPAFGNFAFIAAGEIVFRLPPKS